MRVISKRTLRQFWGIHADAQGPLEAWHSETLKAAWATPQQVKEQFGAASILKAGRVVFNIGGNKYRLVVAMDFGRQACFVKFIGTHAQYNAINAETVNENPTDQN
jgi:mRNA interferase HigB